MAVSVRIEDEAFSDRRYDVLARELGLPDADCARGKMAAVWRQCTQQQTHILRVEMLSAVLGEKGADALIKSELGVAVECGIRICGTRGRIEWLARLRKNARKGGVAKSAKRQPNRQASGSASGVPDACPPAPAPAPAPIIREEGGAGAPLNPAQPKPAKPKATPHPDRARVIDAFHRRFKTAYGSKPTWNGKTVKQVEDLLKKHPGDVLIARINFMFDSRAKWPPPPYSLDAFVANIDRFVDAAPSAQPPLRKEPEL